MSNNISSVIDELKQYSSRTTTRPVMVIVNRRDITDKCWDEFTSGNKAIDWGLLSKDMMTFVKDKKDLLTSKGEEYQDVQSLIDFMDKYMDKEDECIYKIYSREDFNISSDTIWKNFTNIINDDFNSLNNIIQRIH